MSENPTIPSASTLVSLHNTKKQERITESSNIDAKTGSSIFDDILAQICDQIVQRLLEKANNEDATPTFSLDVSWQLRKMYTAALNHLGLSDEYSALSDTYMYKKISDTNTDHSLSDKFKSFLTGSNNLSLDWMSNSSTACRS